VESYDVLVLLSLQFVSRFPYGIRCAFSRPIDLTIEEIRGVLEISRPSLKSIYEDIKQGPGQGISLFYKLVRDSYLNIRRSDVSVFLKNQKVYQITKSQNFTTNKPIMSSSPNERYGINCINMVSHASANGGVDRGTKFILTIVDYFSRKAWLRPLISQTAVNVRNALVNLVQETKTYPRIIQADNGSEFKRETSEWMKDNNITYIKTLSYSPESNGLVEGTNKKVSKVLQEIMIRTNSLADTFGSSFVFREILKPLISANNTGRRILARLLFHPESL
jgi:hypothetical protein